MGTEENKEVSPLNESNKLLEGEILSSSEISEALEKMEQAEPSAEQVEQIYQLVKSSDLEESSKILEKVISNDPLVKAMESHELVNKITQIYALSQTVIKELLGEIATEPEDRSVAELNVRAFGTSLQRFVEDNYLTNIRNKDTAASILSQLAKCVRLVTSLAKIIDLEFEGEVIEPSIDFSKWNYNKLNRLGTHISTIVENLRVTNDTMKEQVRNLEGVIKGLTEKESKAGEKIKNDSSISDNKISVLEASVKRLSGLLASHVDQQAWTVARIDLTTKLPIRYYYEGTDGEIHSTKEFHKALIFSLKEARQIRWDVAQHLQNKAKRNEIRFVDDSVVIMQTVLMTVDLTSNYEE